MQAPDRRARLTPARRRVLDRLFEELMGLEAAVRERRLAELSDTHPRASRWIRPLIEASTEPTEIDSTPFERLGHRVLEHFEIERERLPAGTRLGPWRIEAPAGVGGMGMVYRASRADGLFEMDVAIKIMRARDPGFAQRIASETRLLARLDHRAVARVIDGGETEDGRPYLVMEWVPGENLDVLARRERPGCKACLELFEQVAEAVAHAHQRLIVHADIKPANVRVLPDGRVRLLDFGVARLVEDRGDSADGTGALTPAFAAPEQKTGRPASTQSDVWSLGALLRWMVTRQSGPFEGPLEPSALDAPRAADLAAVINKAMAPHPEERYAGVPALLADLRALCAMEPVAARSAGSLRRLGLWALRHRLAAALGTLALVSILAGIAGQAWQARLMVAERDAARAEARRSAMLREQMVLLFRDVGLETAAGEEVSARRLLDESAALASERLAGDPESLGAVKVMLAELYIAMDDFAAAEPLLKEFLAVDPAGTSPLLRVVAYGDLAQIELRRGGAEKALEHVDRALEIARQLPGEQHSRVADLLSIRGQALRGLGRWEDSLDEQRRALELAMSGDRPSRVRARVANNLGTTLIYAGRAAESMPYLEIALEDWRSLGLEDGSDALTVMANLAGVLHQQGRIGQAEPLYREAIERREGKYGPSGALGAAYVNLGNLSAMRYRIDEAIEQARHGAELIGRFEGEQSLGYARALVALGRVKLTAGDYRGAAEHIGKGRRVLEERVGPDHLFSQIARLHEARLLRRIAPAKAGEALEALVDELGGLQPASERHLAMAWCELAELEIDRGRSEAAREAAGRCLDLSEAVFPEHSWMLAEARALHAAALLKTGETEARQILRRARQDLADTFGEGHPRLRWCDRWLDA